MFNVGGGEFLVIALIALIVVGPEQLPGLLRKAGRYAAQIKSMGDSVREEFMAGAEDLDPRRWDEQSRRDDDEKPKRGKGTADDPILPRKATPASGATASADAVVAEDEPTDLGQPVDGDGDPA